jgi:type IV pilus assembly protein PilP
VFRKASTLVTTRTRSLTGDAPLAPDAVGRFLGISIGAAFVVAALAGAEATARAQQAPAEAPAAAKPASPAPAAPTRAYTYDPGGRRDPFTNLDRASDPKGSARDKLVGLAGLAINEATVKGVVKSQGRLVAMVQSPDNKTYIVRPNDRLLDGAVRAVTPEAVVFVQQVSDPLSLVKQREIRKPLRTIEEGK